jgi:hypothetical protein
MALTTASLRSRKIHRIIEIRKKATRISSAGGKILSKLARAASFGFSALVSFFNLDFSSLWDVMVEGYFALKTFDWNATDKALEKQIEQNNKSIVNVLADAIGEQIGFGAVRLATVFTGKFGDKSAAAAQHIKIPVLASRTGLALADEANEEVRNQVRRLLTTATKALVSNALITATLTARRNEWFGAQSITKPQSNGSIAAKVEEKIEKLPEFWRQPVENLFEGIESGIIQAGYVVTTQVDDLVAASRYAKKESSLVRTIDVKVIPGSEETLRFHGPQEEIKGAIQGAIATAQILGNRDVGLIAGSPRDERMQMPNQLRHLTIFFTTNPTYPDNPSKKKHYWAEVSVPDVKAGLSAKDLKSTLTKFTRGPTCVTGRLSNGRSLKLYASSKAEGKSTLTQLCSLSSEALDIESLRYSEGSTGPEVEVVYPFKAVLNYPRRKKGRPPGPPGDSIVFLLWSDNPSSTPTT